MDAKEAIDILNDCYDSEIGGYCGRSQEVAKFIQSLQAENISLKQQIDHIVEVRDIKKILAHDYRNLPISELEREEMLEIIKGVEK